jgi:hypothetical protein
VRGLPQNTEGYNKIKGEAFRFSSQEKYMSDKNKTDKDSRSKDLPFSESESRRLEIITRIETSKEERGGKEDKKKG